MRKVQVAKPFVGQEELEAVQEVLVSGRYVSGPRVQEFERALADYLGADYAVAVNSGTAALHLALQVLGIGRGDEVIVPPLTFFATIEAVLYTGARPVFADIDAESFCLDPQDVQAKITSSTRAIIPVHLWGNAAEMDQLLALAKQHNIYLIEDAAQAHGTEYKGKKVGALGDIGCFSFFATKHITTGEGGALITNSQEWAEQARRLRSHGMADRDTHEFLGYNYRMPEMAGAMGTVQLKKLDQLNKKRVQNSLYLLKSLSKKRPPWLQVPVLRKDVFHTFFWCPIIIDEDKLGYSTKQLAQNLKDRGVETRSRYWEPLYKQPVLQKLYPEAGYQQLFLPVAEKYAGKVLGLPNHPGLSRAELDYVLEVINKL